VTGLLELLKDGAKYLDIDDFPHFKELNDFTTFRTNIQNAIDINDITKLGYSVDSLLKKINYKNWAKNLLQDPVSPILTPNELNSVVDSAVNKLINSKIPLSDEINNITKDLDTKLKNLWLSNGTWDDSYEEIVKQLRIQIKSKIIAKLKINNPKIFNEYVEDMSKPIIKKFLNSKELGVLLKMLKEIFVKTSAYQKKLLDIVAEYNEVSAMIAQKGQEPEDIANLLRLSNLIELAATELRILNGKKNDEYKKLMVVINDLPKLYPKSQTETINEFITRLNASPSFDNIIKITDIINFDTAAWKQLKLERRNTWNRIFNMFGVKRFGTYNDAINSHPISVGVYGIPDVWQRFTKPLLTGNVSLLFKNAILELAVKATGLALAFGFTEAMIEWLVFVSLTEENAKKINDLGLLMYISPFDDYKEYDPLRNGISNWDKILNGLVYNPIKNTIENIGLANLIGLGYKVFTLAQGGLVETIKSKQAKILELNNIPDPEERRKNLESFLSEERSNTEKAFNLILNEVNSISKYILKANMGRESNPNPVVIPPVNDTTTDGNTTQPEEGGNTTQPEEDGNTTQPKED
jgi:hypothetical protein